MDMIAMGVAVIVIILATYFWTKFNQRHKWNGGICKQTGEKWVWDGEDDFGHYYKTASGQKLLISEGADHT